MSFPRYPKYKDSGVEWLGEVPEHWEVHRLATLGRFSKGSGRSKADESDSGIACIRYGQLYSSYSIKIERAVSFIPESLRNCYTTVHRGQVLFAASGETIEEIGKSAVVMLNEAVCGGDVIIFEPIKRDAAPAFWGYMCDSATVQGQKSTLGRGLTVMHIYPTQLRGIRVPIPPLPEQTAIAAFLDRETAKIDGLVLEQRRLMELLKEKRQAVISHAVTKGLNPDAPMKPSGIEWLGDVPEHWGIWKLTHAFEKIGSGTTPKTDNRKYYDGGTHPWVNTGDLNDGDLNDCAKKITDLALSDHTTLRIYPAGSVVIAMYGATIGKLAILQFPASVNQACCVFSGKLTVEYKFLFFWLLAYRPQIISLASGGGQPNVNQDILRGLRLACPGHVEQTTIIEFLEAETIRFDTLTAEAQRAIDLLQERRTALISAAVTGQIDVRKLVTTTN